MLNRLFRNLLLVSIVLISYSCEKEDPIEDNSSLRTVLIYIAANNNLANDAEISLKKIQKGAEKIKGNLLVLIKTEFQKSYLLKVNADQSTDTLRVYPDGNTSDPAFLSKVISDSKLQYPANSYGFVFWSHATSWAPPSNFGTKSVGYDFGEEMDIKDFKRALPNDLDYIMFDACSMASLEALYELKDKAKYILASPSEVMSASYPYQSIVPYLFGDVNDLIKIGKEFIQYYESLNGELSSATVSLVNTQELTKLADLTKNLLESKKSIDGIDRSSIQKLNFDINTQNPDAYDFLDFLKQNYSEEDYLPIKHQLDKVILFKGYTDSFLGVPIKSFSGVTIYLPIAQDPLKGYYNTLNWSNDSYWISLFH